MGTDSSGAVTGAGSKAVLLNLAVEMRGLYSGLSDMSKGRWARERAPRRLSLTGTAQMNYSHTGKPGYSLLSFTLYLALACPPPHIVHPQWPPLAAVFVSFTSPFPQLFPCLYFFCFTPPPAPLFMSRLRFHSLCFMHCHLYSFLSISFSLMECSTELSCSPLCIYSFLFPSFFNLGLHILHLLSDCYIPLSVFLSPACWALRGGNPFNQTSDRRYSYWLRIQFVCLFSYSSCILGRFISPPHPFDSSGHEITCLTNIYPVVKIPSLIELLDENRWDEGRLGVNVFSND